MNWFQRLFSSEGFMPRAICGNWTPGEIFLHNASDFLIWTAYIAIPLVLTKFAYARRRELPFRKLFWLFGVFILACGTTHLMDIVMFYNPLYRVAGVLKLITAVASWGTVFALFHVTPLALRMRSPEELEREIEQRQRAEEELKQAHENLEQRVVQRTAELQTANQSLLTANRELEAFSYTVSHDLRAPVRAMIGFTQILSDEHADQLSDDARRQLQRISDNAQKMGDLVDDLLRFTRLGRQSLAKQALTPDRITRQVWNELAAEREGRAIELTIEDLPPCHGDPALLKQVFFNLLSNALKYSRGRQPACIEVGSRVENGETIYFVRDNGVGFDMQYVGKLFGVFQRLHSAKEFEGTGVGLAIVQRIVHRHGGQVWAEAEVGKGATFYFSLGKEGVGE